jgi:DNA-binding Lrp family transcriptional regulator
LASVRRVKGNHARHLISAYNPRMMRDGLKVRKQLDHIDIKILEALGVYGPRNVERLAERLGMPVQTVRDRTKRLKSLFSLQLQANIYHTYIGLKKAFVFAKANPGFEDLLKECLKAEGYYLYLARTYAPPRGYYGIYGIPAEHTADFERFIKEIEKLNATESIKLSWSTCIQTINLTDNWFDQKSSTWTFNWDKWVRKIENQGIQLPPTLTEQQSYPQKADIIDILILTELEKDATSKLRDIAKILNLSPLKVQYHFTNHVIRKGFIEGYAVLLPGFGKNSDIFCFRFDFNNSEDMAKFALSLMSKPFARGMSKIYGENALFVHIHLPRKEFGGFMNTLAGLVRKGFLRNYDYVIEDPSRPSEQQTISYEFFENGTWTYNHKKHLNDLRSLVSSYPSEKTAKLQNTERN